MVDCLALSGVVKSLRVWLLGVQILSTCVGCLQLEAMEEKGQESKTMRCGE